MEEINAFLAQQPWWVISIGTAVIVLFIVKRIQSSSEPYSKQLHSTTAPTSIASSSSEMVHVVSNQMQNSNPNGQKLELTFDGEDARKLHELLSKGDKISAIKYVREKKGLDLLNAKNIIEAMAKIK